MDAAAAGLIGALGGTVVTGGLSLATVWLTSAREERQEHRRRIFELRVETYSEALRFINRLRQNWLVGDPFDTAIYDDAVDALTRFPLFVSQETLDKANDILIRFRTLTTEFFNVADDMRSALDRVVGAVTAAESPQKAQETLEFFAAEGSGLPEEIRTLISHRKSASDLDFTNDLKKAIHNSPRIRSRLGLFGPLMVDLEEAMRHDLHVR